MSLIHHLQQVSDYRTKPLYPLWVVMLLVLRSLAHDVHRLFSFLQ
jgi:hypothetical protein